MISFDRGDAERHLRGVPGARDLPAVKWRNADLDSVPAEKRAAPVANLEKVLSK
ncbi:hypothetical protein [Bradyrhizobium sp. LMTR 3]|uniref:hypothetical protein n=1 Tax=Bradyrhizobium sp. LMTR 3 TaxID=189873 RepID=UPI0015B467AB|nr:hypothetical protein [Bradyrhizobium sp. LMTR 3]